jgi:hypothetical protein
VSLVCWIDQYNDTRERLAGVNGNGVVVASIEQRVMRAFLPTASPQGTPNQSGARLWNRMTTVGLDAPFSQLSADKTRF